jgi:hypothetical protein
MAEVHITTNNKIIPIGNIDYIGDIERPYEWGYKVFLKSGKEVWVSINDSSQHARECRNKLIEKLKNYNSVC